MDFVNKYTWSIHIALNYLGPKALIDLDGSISIGKARNSYGIAVAMQRVLITKESVSVWTSKGGLEKRRKEKRL